VLVEIVADAQALASKLSSALARFETEKAVSRSMSSKRAAISNFCSGRG